MKKLSKSILFFTLFLFLMPNDASAQWKWKGVKGNGNVVNDTRNVSDFNSIKVSTGITVFYNQENNSEVVVETDSNLQEYLITEVKNGVLIIRSKKNTSIRKSSKRNVYVSGPDLELVSASSGSHFEASNTVRGRDIDINVSSGASVDMEVDYARLECATSSGSSADLEGSVDYADLSSSSGSSIDARRMTAKNCDASASSGAGIDISVSQNLEASASSGGGIDYWGNPSTDISRSSGGSVSRKN